MFNLIKLPPSYKLALHYAMMNVYSRLFATVHSASKVYICFWNLQVRLDFSAGTLTIGSPLSPT